MKTIKEIIVNVANQDNLFFSFKNEEQLKKIFRILKIVGFRYNTGKDLSNPDLLEDALKHGSFRITSYGGISYEYRNTYIIYGYREKNIFDFFKELNITIESNKKDFCFDDIDYLSNIKTNNGANAKVLYSSLKNEKPLVVSYSFDENENECILLATKDGKTNNINYDLFLENETISLNQAEMTISEIEERLGINNLKIIK